MAWADRLKAHKLLMAAIAGAAMGALVGLFLPIRAAAPPEPDTGSWALPDAQALKRYRDDEFRGLLAGRYWGELARPGQRGQRDAASNWTLHAIVTRPHVQVAVSSGGKRDQTWVRLGGELPDGSTLVQVSRDGVQFEKDGCRRARPLYPTAAGKAAENAENADACIGAPAAQAVAPESPTASRSGG